MAGLPPDDAEEEWRARCWMFKVYRERGWPSDALPRRATLGRHREEWLAHSVYLDTRVKLPRPRKWRRKNIVDDGAVGDLMRPLRPNDDAKLQAAKTSLQRVRNYFGLFPPWHFERPLGRGGYGLALKYQYRIRETSRYFVVKVSLRDWECRDLRVEETATRKLARAAHCVQMISPGKVGLPPRGRYEYDIPSDDDSSDDQPSSGEESRADEPDEKAKKGRSRKPLLSDEERPRLLAKQAAFQTRYNAAANRERARRIMKGRANLTDNTIERYQLHRKDYLILEYCEHGDLHKLIARVHNAREKFPNRILWSFWMCMVRACVAMSYPPRKFHPDRRKPPLGEVQGAPGAEVNEIGKRIGSDLYEDLPFRTRRWAEKKFVHFDIDPKNIFIDSIDPQAPDGEHRLIPKLKLGDFGLGKEVKPRKRNIYYDDLRAAGKFGYYAPEQFGPEWDYIYADKPGPRRIADQDDWELSEQKIAGNYGPPMNVWGIALTMWQIITGLDPPMPPTRGARPFEGGRRLPPHYAADILDKPAYKHVDPELRTTIARCMAHDPANRPLCGRLLDQAKTSANKYFRGETDEVIRAWLDRFLYTP